MRVYRCGAGLALCLAMGACSSPPSFDKGQAAYQAQGLYRAP